MVGKRPKMTTSKLVTFVCFMNHHVDIPIFKLDLSKDL